MKLPKIRPVEVIPFREGEFLIRDPLLLSEEVLDILAYQFHIEGYDLATTIEEKRNFIKKAIEMHRYKGTKWAIERVLEILDLNGNIKEWYEYGGRPYYFKVEVDINKTLGNKIVLSAETQQKLLNLISDYKNERSWLDKLKIRVVEDKKLTLIPNSKTVSFTKTNFKQNEKKEVEAEPKKFQTFSTTRNVSFAKPKLEQSNSIDIGNFYLKNLLSISKTIAFVRV